MIKKIFIGLAFIVCVVVATGFWFVSLIPESETYTDIKQTKPEQLEYLSRAIDYKGKILAVVTSTDKMGTSGKTTGYELTELARAYYVFKANGFDVDIASTKGGKPPVVIDGDDMGEFDYAFINDSDAQSKVNNTLLIDDINVDAYEAIYFVGGKGAMFDFPDNIAIQNLIKHQYQQNKVIGAVCHGPAALANVLLDNGQPLLSGKKVSAFTNDEELFLIPDAREVFPFLLEDRLKQQGASFKAGATYLEQVSIDGKLITGQNPWSVWTLAENMIVALGHTPIKREITSEEHSINLLKIYEMNGYEAAKTEILTTKADYQSVLILMHSIVAFMKMDISKGFDLVMMTNTLKNLENQH